MVHRRRSVSRHCFNHNSGDDGAHGGYGRYGKSFEFSFIIIIFNFNFRRQGYRIFAILTILTISCGQKTSKIKASGVWQKYGKTAGNAIIMAKYHGKTEDRRLWSSIRCGKWIRSGSKNTIL